MALSSQKSIEQLSQELLAGAASLSGSARRVFRWQAALCWLAAGTAVLLVLLIGDMLLRREELGLRVMSLLAWLAVVVWGAFRWLRPAWNFAPTPIQVARWIEQRQPGGDQRLSTAVELASLPIDETRYGSRGFREFALRQWSAQGNLPDWQQFLDTARLRRAALACGALFLMLAGLTILWPGEMRVAMARLAMPWSAHHWPQRDRLVFRDPPSVVAIGSEVQLEIVDSYPPLPERVELQMRSTAANSSALQSSFETIQVAETAVGNLPTVNASIEVRAIGGDDRSMAWHRIEVVQPPQLTDYQFIVQPPAYSGLAKTEVIGRRIAVLVGSQVEFRGRFSQPIKQVAIQLRDQPTADSKQEKLSARISNDGELLLGAENGGPLILQQSLDWQLTIVTADGLEMQLPERWRIEATVDAPPLVAMQTSDMSELSANAQLALKGAASDDLGLEEVVAQLRVAGDENVPPTSLPIWSAKSNPSTVDELSDAARRELTIESQWNISQLSGLVTGQRIEVWLEARDSAGQWGRSDKQEFAIRDPQDLVNSIQGRQGQLLEMVRELVDTQRRNSQLFSRADEVARQSDRIEREQLDLFRNVVGVQRTISQQFQADGQRDGHGDGLKNEIAKLSELLTQNRLDGTELADELQALQNKITELGEGVLQTAARTSEESLQVAQALHNSQTSVASKLSQVNQLTAEAQTDALRGLESLLDRLARNEAVQQVQRELAQILNQQNTLRSETDKLQLERLSSTNSAELGAKQTALSADQQGLARRLDDLVRRAEELQASASADQQSLRTQLERATQSLNKSQASAKMRRSTEEIRSEKFAQAALTQQEVAQLLAATLQQLGAGNISQLGSLQNRVDGLRQTSQELSQLAQEQTRLAEQWNNGNAGRDNEQLLREQSALQERTRQQASAAEQVGDASLTSELENAASEQQTAQSSGQRQNFQQASAAGKRAAEQLEKSAERLQQRAGDLEQQVAEQQLSELTVAIEQLAAEQRPVAESFSQLSQSTVDSQQEALQAEIRQTASQQESVRQVLRDVRGKTSKLPTFDWTLEQAEGSMSRAVAAAQRYRVQPDANDAAAEALRLLELAAAAMQNEAPQKTADDEQQAKGDAAEQDSPTSQLRPLPMIASLKLLRSLQHEIIMRTNAAESAGDSARRSQKLNELSVMQHALGKQIDQLLREIAAANDTGENR